MALGTHLLVEYFECDKTVLCDSSSILQALKKAAEVSGVNYVNSILRTNYPWSVSCIITISESHLSIHTRADYAYAAVDLYTCGDVGTPEKGFDLLH